jgi:DNA-binding LacI/PurR family transcriptional regulator
MLAGGRQATKALRDAGPRPTAVFASNTPSGIGALNATLDAGIRVADESAVHLSAASKAKATASHRL